MISNFIWLWKKIGTQMIIKKDERIK
jgi:hypothetical protein